MAAGVGQQVPKRDRTRSRAKLRRAVGIKASEHLGPFELRQHLAHRRVKTQPSLLHKLQRAGAGDGLGHRRDPENAVRLHAVAGRVAGSGGAHVGRALPRASRSGDPAHVAARDGVG